MKSVLRNVLCSCDAASAVPLVQRGDGGTDNLQSGVSDLLERFLLLGGTIQLVGAVATDPSADVLAWYANWCGPRLFWQE